jgi:hypothetical protein
VATPVDGNRATRIDHAALGLDINDARGAQAVLGGQRSGDADPAIARRR